MKEVIVRRVEALRAWMKEKGIQAFLIPSTDPHAGEYVPAHWMARSWISGFDGSAGTAVVTLTQAALWTDSRYFLAAGEALDGTPFCLMKENTEGTPSPAEWLRSVLRAGDSVGVDGLVNGASVVYGLSDELSAAGISVRDAGDPMADIWTERPALPDVPVEIQPMAYAGCSCRQKLDRLRGIMRERGADALLVSALDEVAWITNLRGRDVHCNPVFVGYLLLTDDEAVLCSEEPKFSDEVRVILKNEGVRLQPYASIEDMLRSTSAKRVWLTPATNYRLTEAVPADRRLTDLSPVAPLKAVKNEAEIAGFRRAMERDGVAMVRFLRWLKPAVAAGGQTECSIDRKLTALRAEQPLYRDISFDTIAGYEAHGAIVHYEATPETDAPLRAEGLLLLDSGAQYQDGTTDITRTIALGPVSDEQKLHYTLVLKGHIALSRCCFPEGSSGTQLDVCARYAMWREGLNYGHGTGHGVGSYLNVHEGPHQIRMNYMPAPLRAGMTVTDEPGLYLSGRYGVRIENTLLIVPFCENEFGRFLRFEPLTLCPIDTEPILWERLTDEEVAWLNDYHAEVRNRLLPLLQDDADRQWLIEATESCTRP